MNSNESQIHLKDYVEVQCDNRWQAYRRLQELEIPSACGTYQPLRVEFSSPLAIAQVWSVIRQHHLSRQALIAYLDQCWQLSP
ncbi:MAG: hypothetical protein KME35_02530 [Aphanocapsa sp. GSE-SYN-MK-11-07L]|jgi:hypothetical protein|nr:hypothetical protein [Aphanocapsa sp. GSE-SYN-MK-11-07L]